MSVLADIANLRNIPIELDVVYDPPLLGLDVFTPGELQVIDAAGTDIIVEFPGAVDGGEYPHRWWIRIRQIVESGTTITDMEGIK